MIEPDRLLKAKKAPVMAGAFLLRGLEYVF